MLDFPQNNHFVERLEEAVAKVDALTGREQKRSRDVLRKVPTRPKNLEVRSREYLLPDEVDALIAAASSLGRHRLRDKLLILTAYRHGLRVSELVGLKWDQIDLRRAQMHVNRLKNGSPSTHPIEADELRFLRRLKREYPDTPFIFTTERGGPLARSTVSKLLARAGEEAGLAFPAHPHMLRHGTGYYLANKGVPTRTIQAYLGHKSIQHTVRYTRLSPEAFRGIWD